jgi:hypothetical protein
VPEKSVPNAQYLKIAESFGVKKSCLATIGGRIEDPHVLQNAILRKTT